MRRIAICLFLLAAALAPAARADEPRTDFKVKYTVEGAVYLDGGRSSGLATGMKLQVRQQGKSAAPGAPAAPSTAVIGELVVVNVTESSAVCEVVNASGEMKRGDVATLAEADMQTLVRTRSVGRKRVYPQVISFDPGEDPVEEEVRAAIPRPPSPEINRARGRIGMDHTSVMGRNGSPTSRQTGLVMRMDVTRIGGTFWNLNGYWRGRWNSRPSAQNETLIDLQNRTYHLALTYSNPNSRMVAGFGRLNLPWASSLETLDGGYFGWRLNPTATTGVFAGSSPDPSSWNYDPQRQIAGAFLNVERGSFEGARYSGTFGMAYEAKQWKVERPFVFFENAIFYKHAFSIYHTLQADKPRDVAVGIEAATGVSRSYLTVRAQPHKRVTLDLSHNYFRDLPRFDPRLIGTGMVDKLLFEGLSGGTRIELPQRFAVYTSLGRSDRTGDTKKSWNRMYGVSWGRIPWIDTSADLRFSTFDSSFGTGTYRSLSLVREIHERYRVELQAGRQSYTATLSQDTGSRFLNATLDASLGERLFVTGGFTAYRGTTQSYDQLSTTLGYRFDSRAHRHVD